MGVRKWECLGITKPPELLARGGDATRIAWRVVVQKVKILLDLVDTFANRACIIGV